MIQAALTFIENLVISFGPGGIFVGAFIEEIFSFIPSAAVMMFSGFFVLGGQEINTSSIIIFLLQVVLPLSLGITIGSLLVYGISYALGKPAIERFGKWFGISWDDILKIQRYLNRGKSDEIVLFFLRATPIIPFVVINACCGLLKWPIRSYLSITFFGCFIRATLTSFIGWQLGSLYKDHVQLFDQLESTILNSFIVVVLLFIGYRFYKKRKDEKEKTTL